MMPVACEIVKPGLARRVHDAEWEAACEVFAGPLFDALRRELENLSGFPDIAMLNELAARSFGSPLLTNGRVLRLVEAVAAAKGLRPSGYEARVHLESEIETRPGNWHDMFNALVWIAWPRAKAALNAVHARQTHNEGVTTHLRGVARDLATLFDEGGAVIACSDPALGKLLRDFHWKELFCARRRDVQSSMRCYIFGHAIFDKARKPYKAMTAHVLIFPVAPDFFRQTRLAQIAALDALVAGWFGDFANLDSTQRFAPLPVLGFPGFCTANEEPQFYDDAAVFRPGRVRMTRQ